MYLNDNEVGLLSTPQAEDTHTLKQNERSEIHQTHDTAFLPFRRSLLLAQTFGGLTSWNAAVRVHDEYDVMASIDLFSNCSANGVDIWVETLNVGWVVADASEFDAGVSVTYGLEVVSH